MQLHCWRWWYSHGTEQMSFGSGVVTLIHSCCEVVWYSHGMEQTSFGKGCEAEMQLQIHRDQLQVGCEAEMQL